MNPFDTLLYTTILKGGNLDIWFSCENISFCSIREKWDLFGSILDNMFLGNDKREEIISAFSKIQRAIHGMYRFRHIWRVRRAKWYNADDLYMNPISSKDRGAIVLFENNTKYVFQTRELIHVVHFSLSNCCHYFPDPNQCKNPYTNLPFHKSNLYNMYFAMRSSQYRMPPLFDAFFRENFNYNLFLTKNEQLINDEYLRTYVENNCVEDVLEHVKEMFKDHHIRSQIHFDFPKDKLYKIMKPYLSLYFLSNYSINHHKKARAFRSLHRKLHKFYDFNQCFGRRKVRFVSKNPFSTLKKCVYFFDDKHIPFYDEEPHNFLTSHLDSPVSNIHLNRHIYFVNDQEENDQGEEEEERQIEHGSQSEESEDEYDDDDDDEEYEENEAIIISHEEEDEDEDDEHI